MLAIFRLGHILLWEGTVILEDGVRSQILEIYDCDWLHNLTPIFHCIEITFKDDKFCFVSERDIGPQHHTAPIERYHIRVAPCITF